MWKLLLILPWGGAAALAWWYTETNGSRIKKCDPSLYDKLSNDKNGEEKAKLKKELAQNKTLQEQNIKKINELKEKTGDDNDDDNQTQIKKLEEIIAKKETEIQIAESVDGKMWMPVWSITNMAWMLGIFFGVGIIGHFIFKQIIKLFAGENKE